MYCSTHTNAVHQFVASCTCTSNRVVKSVIYMQYNIMWFLNCLMTDLHTAMFPYSFNQQVILLDVQAKCHVVHDEFRGSSTSIHLFSSSPQPSPSVSFLSHPLPSLLSLLSLPCSPSLSSSFPPLSPLTSISH